MSQVIIFQNDIGGVSVCIPTGEISIDAVLKKDCPAGAFIVEQESLPNADIDFFNAWVLNGETVSVDLAKAKEVTKQRLRVQREPVLAAQDVAFQRALEEGKDTTNIVAEKQRLRDITKLADTAATLDELRNIKVN